MPQQSDSLQSRHARLLQHGHCVRRRRPIFRVNAWSARSRALARPIAATRRRKRGRPFGDCRRGSSVGWGQGPEQTSTALGAMQSLLGLVHFFQLVHHIHLERESPREAVGGAKIKKCLRIVSSCMLVVLLIGLFFLPSPRGATVQFELHKRSKRCS